jgi:hypothetical protein
MTDVSPALTRKHLSRSSSATRAQQQPLQRREATHTLPMVNTPSPPDYTLLTVQAKSEHQLQPVQQVPQASRAQKPGDRGQDRDGDRDRDTRKQEQQPPQTQQPQLQLQQPQQQQLGFRKGSSQQNSNIYSPGVNYDLSDKTEVSTRKKSGTAKGHFSSLPNSKFMQIPLFRPKGEPPHSTADPTQSAAKTQERQLCNPLPYEKQALIKQPTQGPLLPNPNSSSSSTSNSNIFDSMNLFKGFNPFGLIQQNAASPSVNRIPPHITNSPNAAKSPKVELIHSRPTRPIASAGFFSSPSSSFALLSVGGGGRAGGRSSDALSDATGGESQINRQVSRTSSGNAFNWFSSGENSSEYAMSAPRSEDDLTFMVRTSVTRPTTIPQNPTSPSSLSHNNFT